MSNAPPTCSTTALPSKFLLFSYLIDNTLLPSPPTTLTQTTSSSHSSSYMDSIPPSTTPLEAAQTYHNIVLVLSSLLCQFHFYNHSTFVNYLIIHLFPPGCNPKDRLQAHIPVVETKRRFSNLLSALLTISSSSSGFSPLIVDNSVSGLSFGLKVTADRAMRLRMNGFRWVRPAVTGLHSLVFFY